MEDALAHKGGNYYEFLKNVLILVVMEDALAPYLTLYKGNEVICLNPCCNGRCTRTAYYDVMLGRKLSCLNPCCNGRCTRTVLFCFTYVFFSVEVLILVVMEDALAPQYTCVDLQAGMTS